jgi:DNA-binding beta-propeller fold protein YncE
MRITLGVIVSLVTITILPTVVGRAQSQPYELVASWPALPSGTFFGQQTGWPDQSARDAAAAARRAAGQARRNNGGTRPTTPPIYGQGVSGIAIDEQDHIYVFNRGEQTVMVFDREGTFVRAGAEQDMHGQPVAGGWLHSGEVDWEGNVWVVERLNHRILKFDPTLTQALMQIGVTGEPGNDETHLNSPSGILFTREGNIIVTDGYGNNRVVLYSPDGTFIKQVGRGAGGPNDQGTGDGEWDLPHQGAVDADDRLYLIDRENKRIQVFDNQLNYVREFANEGWNPWDIAISRRGDDGVGYIADHAGERVHKIALENGQILATWGGPGRGPGQFDWVHGMAVDTQGAVYAADTYGQRVQKFVPASAP